MESLIGFEVEGKYVGWSYTMPSKKTYTRKVNFGFSFNYSLSGGEVTMVG